MQRALYPDLFTPSAAGPLADPVDVMESVTEAPIPAIGCPVSMRRPPHGRRIWPIRRSGNRFRTLLLDPVTATLLGELDDRSFIRDLQDLHFDLLGGRTGRLVNGVGALCLVAMCLTGAVIWWPGRANWRRSLKVDFTRQWKRVNWDLHSAVGFWSVVVHPDVGGDRRLLRVSFRVSIGGQSALTDHGDASAAIESARRAGASADVAGDGGPGATARTGPARRSRRAAVRRQGRVPRDVLERQASASRRRSDIRFIWTSTRERCLRRPRHRHAPLAT